MLLERRVVAARLDHWALLLALLAAGLVAAGIGLDWRGVDLPAQLYRVDLVRQHGFSTWDSQWFGGQWVLAYSVLFPAVAAALGVGVVSVASAAVATLAFDRLIVWHFGRQARVASLVFAVSVIVQTSIGQLTFLLGEALALCCCAAMARRRWFLAAPLAVAASLSSPLAGAFAALGAAAWLVSRWRLRAAAGPVSAAPAAHRPAVTRALAGRPRHWRGVAAVLAAVAVPIGVVGLLFPGQGAMPYPLADWAWEVAIAGGLFWVTPRRDRVLRTGLVLFALAATVCVAVSSPIGGNIGRIEDCVAFPLATALLWPSRRRVVLALMAVPLLVSQWAPAWDAMTTNSGHPWTHQAYYQPLVAWLHHAGGPAGRVEVVPTADHWEAAYVAPTVALARGWERQMDRSHNPIFYSAGMVSPAAYQLWLEDNGVRFVALPSAPLDSAGVAEGKLISAGLPELRLAWRSPNWRVYAVEGSTGIVSGPATVLQVDGGSVLLDVHQPGPLLLRVRYSPGWVVLAGQATVTRGADDWVALDVPATGLIEMQMRVPLTG